MGLWKQLLVTRWCNNVITSPWTSGTLPKLSTAVAALHALWDRNASAEYMNKRGIFAFISTRRRALATPRGIQCQTGKICMSPVSYMGYVENNLFFSCRKHIRWKKLFIVWKAKWYFMQSHYVNTEASSKVLNVNISLVIFVFWSYRCMWLHTCR